MRNVLPICLLVLLGAGCGTKASQPFSGVMPAPVSASPDGGDAQGQASYEPPRIYQGRPAPYWADRLANPDPIVRQEATLALGRLDQDGFPHLLQGMKSNSREMKLGAMQAVYQPVLLKHAAQALPVLSQLAEDRDPLVRHNAVVRLAWLEKNAESAMRLLQRIAALDANPDIRNAARESLVVINYHVTGIKPSHGAAGHMEKPQ